MLWLKCQMIWEILCGILISVWAGHQRVQPCSLAEIYHKVLSVVTSCCICAICWMIACASAVHSTVLWKRIRKLNKFDFPLRVTTLVPLRSHLFVLDEDFFFFFEQAGSEISDSGCILVPRFVNITSHQNSYWAKMTTNIKHKCGHKHCYYSNHPCILYVQYRTLIISSPGQCPQGSCVKDWDSKACSRKYVAF